MRPGVQLCSHRVIASACRRLSQTGTGRRSMRGGRETGGLKQCVWRWRECFMQKSAADRREVTDPGARPRPTRLVLEEAAPL